MTRTPLSRAGTCLLAFGLMLASPAMAATECSSKSDQEAFNVGALKSELSILAIACANQDNYNHFVEKFRPELVSEDQVVSAWFNKTYGKAGRAHYDNYITLLANEQSSVGLHEGTDFCPRLGVLFAEAMAVPDTKLLPQYAAGKNLVPAALGSCAVETAVASKPEARRSTRHR